MKPTKHPKILLISGLAAMLAALSMGPDARANVYATNIKLNGSLTAATNASGGNLSISYILNEPATAGTTINILSNATVIDTITVATGNPGALMGLNTVIWGGTNTAGSPVPPGNYSVSITAAATGFNFWTQTSIDSTSNITVFPHGMAVDQNSNSPYYGRVVVTCNANATTRGVPQKVGLYKYNADSSPADEGSFGYAGYTTNEAGGVATGAMPTTRLFSTNGAGVVVYRTANTPTMLRIGEDDRIYFMDHSGYGTVVSCDMLATTNITVIGPGVGNASTGGAIWPSYANPNGLSTYDGNPYQANIDNAGSGFGQFDIINAGRTNAAILLGDQGDFPSNPGVWMYRLTNNGTSDTNDIVGTQVVMPGGDIGAVVGSGVSIDYNLNVYVGQNRGNSNDVLTRVACFTNWNSGVMPAGGLSTSIAEVSGSLWNVGSADNNFCNAQDTVIDSRSHPKYLACPILQPTGSTTDRTSAGIRVLNATDGSVVSVTNGATVQSLTNIDYPNLYTCAAWDAVGNLYTASTSTNQWRVWSPPGTNQATTVSVATLAVTSALVVTPTITSIVSSGGVVTITFTGAATDPSTAFTLLSSSTVNPASSYTPAAGAVISGSGGTYTATVTAGGSLQYYRIKR